MSARGTGRPSGGYYLQDGTRVPSVTTINGAYGRKDNLIDWAKRTWYARGAAGQPFEDEEAVRIGTLVHALIEARIHGTPVPAIPVAWETQVRSAYSAFREWLAGTRLEIVATEQPLVSERHRFGGTLDAVVRDARGRVALGDWKSSKQVREEYLRQLAAYGLLWNETHPDEPLTGGFHVVRFSKSHGDMEHRWFPELDAELAFFLDLRDLYERDKTIKRRAA